jgi:2-succinyl-6-hydroxy-2,4-cyclohexadiene-1-carboxylate synthase
MIQIYALHGFLGMPKDWDFFKPMLSVCPISLFSYGIPKEGFWAWSRNFNRWISNQAPSKRLLLGYSLGGRLAMHALLENPSLWDSAIMISANPGLHSDAERGERKKQDSIWSQRFLEEPWDKLMASWNNQAIFQTVWKRLEKDFSRRALADALTGWSLGIQENLRRDLAKLAKPILWIAGGKDPRYEAIARDMAELHPLSQCWIEPNSAHRVPWEAPDLFIDRLNIFIEEFHAYSNHIVARS